MVLLVLVIDIFDFEEGIVFDLLYDFFIVFLHSLYFPFQLLCLSYLTLHQNAVLLHYLVDVLVMLISNMSESVIILAVVFLFLSLQLLEGSRILKHLLGVLIPLLLQLNLVLFSQLLDSLLESVLHFALVLIKRVVSVLRLHLGHAVVLT